MGERQRRLMRLFQGRAAEMRELDEELETHLALRAEELMRTGLSADAALAEARLRLGDREVLYATARQRSERVRRSEWWGSVRSDVTLAQRRAGSAPGATALTVATFALGIGLTTAGFAVVDHVLLRPLPFPEPHRLVALQSVDSLGGAFPRVSAASWREWATGARTLSASAVHDSREWSVLVGDVAVRVRGQAVTEGFFEVLSAPMRLGRALTPAEIEAGEAVAVVSERFWRSALGSREDLPDALRLDAVPYRVVGVVAQNGGWPGDADLWIGFQPSGRGAGAHNRLNFGALARLAPGVTLEQAEAELSSIARGIREADAGALYSFGVGVLPLRELMVRGTRLYLQLLAGAVVLVLLIACANVAGLGLARGDARLDELRVRMALGAGRDRLVRQLLTEQVLFAAVGGGLGVLLAWSVTRVLAVRATDMIPRASELVLDFRVFAFGFVVTLLAGVASGVAPAWRGASTPLRAGGEVRGGVRGGRGLPGAALVAVEVAIALTLLVGAGLLLRSLGALLARDLGFRTEGVVTASASLPSARYVNDDVRRQFWASARERITQLPRVTHAAFAHRVPGDRGAVSFIEIYGKPELTAIGADYRVVSEGYFETLDVPVLSGRDFDARDRPGSSRVGLINRSMAERFWPGEDPIGAQVRAPSMEMLFDAPWITIIGVVGDVRHHGYEAPSTPELYVLSGQTPYWTDAMVLVVRTDDPGATGRVALDVTRVLNELDREIAPVVVTLDARLGAHLREQRFVFSVLGLFAGFALVLFAIGLYGSLSFAVARRTREMGIRAALGAPRVGLLRIMISNAMRVVLIGAALGLLGAYWLARLVDSLLVETPPLDPLTYALAAIVLLLVGIAAAFVPAWRAARVDPLVALRTA